MGYKLHASQAALAANDGRAASQVLTRFAPGARVVVRGEEWLVRGTQRADNDTQAVRVLGVSELVRGREAIFLHPKLDAITVLDPRETQLVADDTPGYRRSKLYLESLLRRMPPTDARIYLGHLAAMEVAPYQLVPAARALAQPRPRLLIADAVGLGKTIEVGIALSELIRRGRGRRILVVALKSVLEQFQQELWTRFAIPLVRLDSEGLARVQRSIPANANPFHHYDRVIISLDTLKKDTKYARLLEQCQWDVTVIDECQHVAQRGSGTTQRARLAKLLASTCDALFLTSATPHDGKAESFASLMNLLDPTAVPDAKAFDATQIRDLYVRRFKKDVASGATMFAERKLVRHEVAASAAEDALLEALSEVNFATLRGRKGPGGRAVLFRTLLTKGLLSSPDALLQTLEERARRLQAQPHKPGAAEDLPRLAELIKLANAAQRAGGAKEEALLGLLQKHRGQRVVVFSERIRTLHRLRERLSKALKLPKGAVALFHGGTPDVEQQRIVKEFGTADGRIQLLLASDAAAEGINLHHQCHLMVHFDVPWSLITLEQRNGRIDRFGQREVPEIHYLMLRPRHPGLRGDLQVIDTLLEKEDQAHKHLGDAQWLMKLFDADAESDRVAEAISHHESADAFFDDDDLSDLLAPENDAAAPPVLNGEAAPILSSTDVELGESPSLYEGDFAYARDALRLLSDAGAVQAPDVEPDFEGLTLAMSEDLKARFAYLPPELARACEGDFVRLTSDREVVQRGLVEAREQRGRFPRWQLLWPLHPVLEWLDDRVLTLFGRNEAPVLRVPSGLEPGQAAFVLEAVLSNALSQPVLVRWLAAVFGPKARAPEVRDFDALLEATGLSGRLVNDGSAPPTDALLPLRTAAVTAARTHMESVRKARAEALLPTLRAERRRLEHWSITRLTKLELLLADPAVPAVRKARAERERDEVNRRVADRNRWISQRLSTEAEPYVRLAAVLVPADLDDKAAARLSAKHGGWTP